MKAERRHELQENSLVHWIEAAPFFFRKYGTQILLGVLIVLLAIVLLRKRSEGAREAAEQARVSLTEARSYIQQIAATLTPTALADPKRAIDEVSDIRSRAEERINIVLEHADDPTLLAEAKLARGDLNWELANYPEFREAAATRPSVKLDKSQEQFLSDAAAEYQAVATDPKASMLSRTTARLSLAAVAENRRKWDEAKTHYQTVIEDPQTAEPFKVQARQRLAALDLLKVEQYVSKAPEAPVFAPLPATTQSATAPSATQPATAPAKITDLLPPVTTPGVELPTATPPVEKK